MSHERIIVETYSLELVHLVTSKERDGSALCHLVHDLQILLSSAQVKTILKIPTLCNSASHELARFGMLNKRTQVWVGSVPDVIGNCIAKDCNNSMIF